MKKLVYSISFLVCCSLANKAQNETAPANRAGTPHPNDQAAKPANANSSSAPREGTAYPQNPPVNADGTTVAPERSPQSVKAGTGETATPPANANQAVNGHAPNSAQTAPSGKAEIAAPAANSNQPVNGVSPNSAQTAPAGKSDNAVAPAAEPPVKSRHAITEKGVPASRNKDVNSEKAGTPPNAGGTKTTGKE